MKKILKVIVWIIVLVIAAFVTFLAYQTATEFKPAKEIAISSSSDADTISDTLTLITWNIGYCGLGSEMDFFYEGGKMVRPDEESYNKYSEAVMKRIHSFDTASFILLQEVDTLAKRSYRNNQLRQIEEHLTGMHGSMGLNYNSWVPIPPSEPMGKVRAGQATFSQYKPVTAKRIAFESSYSWPIRLFQLKRCFIETRFLTSDGKQLVLINTHNSAFDDAAELREKELKTLRQLMVEEYGKGNYVIIGGDWNQNPPDFDSTKVLPIYKPRLIRPGIPDDFIPEGWLCAYDPDHTTNRYVNRNYVEGVTYSTLIDFFILSPNIKLENVRTIPTGFRESDHQPVVIKVII